MSQITRSLPYGDFKRLSVLRAEERNVRMEGRRGRIQQESAA